MFQHRIYQRAEQVYCNFFYYLSLCGRCPSRLISNWVRYLMEHFHLLLFHTRGAIHMRKVIHCHYRKGFQHFWCLAAWKLSSTSKIDFLLHSTKVLYWTHAQWIAQCYAVSIYTSIQHLLQLRLFGRKGQLEISEMRPNFNSKSVKIFGLSSLKSSPKIQKTSVYFVSSKGSSKIISKFKKYASSVWFLQLKFLFSLASLNLLENTNSNQ